MKKWLVLTLIVVLAVFAYAASGPYRTIRAISSAVRAQDARALASQVDFPAVRESLKVQLSDRLLRRAGADIQSSPFASFGMRIADGLIGASVDTMVTPLGLGAIMEGRREWAHARSGFQPPAANTEPAPDPLRDAEYRYESPSRFTATIHDDTGQSTVFVITRSGLEWKLADIRLPR